MLLILYNRIFSLMEMTVNIRRGLDLRLKGGVEAGPQVKSVAPGLVAVCPDDFPGFTPKLAVKEGQTIEEGAPLLFDKINPDTMLVSPVAGTVKAVVRGDRRKILRVEVETTPEKSAPATTSVGSDAEALRLALRRSGLWAMMRQLPYDIVPEPAATPRDIFVTAIDSAPLAVDLPRSVEGKSAEIEAGLKALATLTSGKVYVGMRPDAAIPVPDPAVKVVVKGSHPAGNADVLAANIKPVNKGETIWKLDIVTVARMGHLILKGFVDWSTLVAVTGSEVKTPCLVQTVAGAQIKPLIEGNVNNDGHHHRIIAGNVLTGTATGIDGFLHYPYRQITVIPEGDDVNEFMGWASMSPEKMSVSRSFLSRFLPGKKFAPDARLLGGRRAMIMSGEYDKVFPMDVMPEPLLKAIMSRDIDRMEQLGIYEVSPEDFALCEYVDPSKTEIQKTVREGLDYLRKELE